MAATRGITIRINGKEVENTIKSIARESGILRSQLSKLTIGSDEYNKKVLELRRVNATIREHSQNIRGAGQAWGKAQSGIIASAKSIGVAALAAFSVGAVVDFGKELFKTADYMETIEGKAAVVFGEALPAARAEAKRMANQMGLTSTEYLEQASAIQDLLIPMGFQRDKAGEISTALQNLAGAAQEWTAGEITAKQASGAFTKALLGQYDALIPIGVKLEATEVAARLAAKGFEQLTGDALKQAKAAVTLELILEKTTDAQTAFAGGADSMTRKVAILDARLNEAKETLSAALMPVFVNLLEIAADVADGFQWVSESISGLADPTKASIQAFDEQSEKVRVLEKDLVPLLDRYDELQAKDKLSAEEQAELNGLIVKIGDIMPGAITAVDDYGKALGISAGKARELLVVEQARLAFFNEESITNIDAEVAALKRKQAALKEAAVAASKSNTFIASPGGGGVNLNDAVNDDTRAAAREQLAKTTSRLIGMEAELRRLRGEAPVAGTAATVVPGTTGPSDEELAAAAERAQKAREKAATDAAKAAERELEQRKRDFEKLQEFEADNRQKLYEATLEEEARKLEQIARSYDDQIKLAKELELAGQTEATALRLSLETQMQQELSAARAGFAEAEAEKQRVRDEAAMAAQAEFYQAQIQQEFEAKQNKAALLAELDQLYGETSGLGADELTPEQKIEAETEALLAATEKQYDVFREAAKQHNRNVTGDHQVNGDELTMNLEDIEKRRQDSLLAIQKQGGKRTKELEESLAKERLQIQVATLQELGSAFGQIADSIAGKTQQGLEFKKLATLAQIAFDTAAAISTVVATSAGNPFAVVTGIATVLGAIAKAKAVLSQGSVPQYYEGGATGDLHRVRGAKDGRNYQAKYLGRPRSGMLPPRPSLLLASERGPEYFVSNPDLRNPRIFDHVQAIDALRSRRGVRQFVDGGATEALARAGSASAAAAGGTTVAAAPALDPAVVLRLAEAIDLLNLVLGGGIEAVIGDRTAVSLRNRLEQLDRVAGGRVR